MDFSIKKMYQRYFSIKKMYQRDFNRTFIDVLKGFRLNIYVVNGTSREIAKLYTVLYFRELISEEMKAV